MSNEANTEHQTSDPGHHVGPDTDVTDPFFMHELEEGVPQTEHAARVNIPALTIAFFIMTVSLAVTVFALSIYFDVHFTKHRVANEETTNWRTDISIPYREQALGGLESVGWRDEQAGRANVPIDVAKNRIMEQYR